MLYNEIDDESKRETALHMLEFLLSGEFGPEAQDMAKNIVNESPDMESAADRLQEMFDDDTEVEEYDEEGQERCRYCGKPAPGCVCDDCYNKYEATEEDVNGDGDTDVVVGDTNGNGKPDTAVVKAESKSEEVTATKKAKEALDGDKNTSTGKTVSELKDDEDTVSDENMKEKKGKPEKKDDDKDCAVSDKNMKNALPSHIIGCLSDRLY